MRIETLTIVGVGLIGGSVGLAAKARGVASRVIGVDHNPSALAVALEIGAIDEAMTLSIASAVADLIVVCTPVDVIAKHVLAAAKFAKPGTIITDAGSTKGSIVERVDPELANGAFYVGGHPMAGSERKGPTAARADLFENRAVILTETPFTNESAWHTVANFWIALGSRAVRMTPQDHDGAVAAVSHLPHAVAACLAGMTPLDLLSVSAGGFRDTTRVAGAGPGIWEPIFRANRAAMLAAADRFADHWASFRALLAADDGPGLTRWLADAKRVRDALGS
jgi:cyclohexadieny/prephenate dehydrogenase